MITSGILLALTTIVTVAWLFVELTDALGATDGGRSASEDEGTPRNPIRD